MAQFCILYCYGVPKWQGRGAELWAAALGSSAPEAWSIYDVTLGQYPSPAQLAACSGVVITGSPSGVYDDAPWIAPLLRWIRAAVELPAGPRLLGGCFGAQAICQALGGTVLRTPVFVLRAESITAAAPCSAPSPIPSLTALLAQAGGVRLLEAHGDACAALPPGATPLGASASCAHEVFCCTNSRGEVRALGVQAHPEFELEGDVLGRVWPAAAHRLSPEEQAEARASYALPRQDRQVCRVLRAWLLGAAEAGMEGQK